MRQWRTYRAMSFGGDGHDHEDARRDGDSFERVEYVRKTYAVPIRFQSVLSSHEYSDESGVHDEIQNEHAVHEGWKK